MNAVDPPPLSAVSTSLPPPDDARDESAAAHLTPPPPLDHSFFAEWREKLTRFFGARIRHPEDAEDRAQQVLLAIFELTDWKSIRDPKAYVYGAARHLLYQHWTERRRWQEFVGDREHITQVLGELQAAQRDPLGRAVLVDDELDRALAQLHADTRAAADLWLDGYSYAEIAEELSLSVHKVKRKLALAREKLRPLALTLTQG